MEKVIAVVVTYNRLTLLKECITALRNQTQQPDTILVVNNGSTDATSQWLLTQHDLLSITQENTGSGGGFETGIKWGYKNGYSWIWCMDDDGYPKEDALQKILAPDMDRLKLRNCAVLDKTNKKTFVWKTKNFSSIDEVNSNIIEGIGHPFNGTMIHRNIVERVGLPKQKLFMWGDESEYYMRITRKNKIPVCTIADSIHYHPAAIFTFKSDWDYNSTWKMYYYVRNRFHVHQSKFNYKLMAWANYCCFLVGLAGIIMLYQKTDKVKKLNFVLWPASDAIKNDFSANPSNILLRLSAPSTTVKSITGLHLRNSLLSGSLFVAAPKTKQAASM